MKVAGPAAELRSLKRFVRETEQRFLHPHLAVATLAPPSRYEILDVAAHVVLVHGALENFVEGVGLWLLEKTEHAWIMKQRASRATASLMLYHSRGRADASTERSVFDNLRLSLVAAKKDASTLIEQNNGVGPRHLREILRPLGVDVSTNPVFTASLEQLVLMRHAWAHQYRYAAIVPKTAADAKKVTDDCLLLAEDIARQAGSAFR